MLNAFKSLEKSYLQLLKNDHVLEKEWVNLMHQLANTKLAEKELHHTIAKVLRLIEEDRNDLINLNNEGPDNNGAAQDDYNQFLIEFKKTIQSSFPNFHDYPETR